eukprot:TRINITY_DN80281_c0_g1_i1.p1 TRINITY_DN80281_c0_g1~~TRINITY_DN80281_c0_g1_i1.p1  ORF type:complete len:1126 (+),score=268.93 TRINITY_DN80281_c0_g1_i1:143-3520(+)
MTEAGDGVEEKKHLEEKRVPWGRAQSSGSSASCGSANLQQRSGEKMPPVKLGICAMEKKTQSKPMQTILEHLAKTGDFEITHFSEDMILNKPIEEWPADMEFLISFFSAGFPLAKAEKYVKLRNPKLINNLTAQKVLQDRRKVYALLAENGILHPPSVTVERDQVTNELMGAAKHSFVEGEDFIEVGGTRINKPFVEKPLDADDHDICIYYPSGSGGGRKKLFRKVGDQSSSYDPDIRNIRQTGSYMYEPFLKTQGVDIKVYTVGQDYAHAEARKSPVIDGRVNRGEDGKEVRTPVVLTLEEKEIARMVCLAFDQMVCGFDLLRTDQGSFVIDVNGWSFVKGSPKYFTDAAALLGHYMLHQTGRTATMRSVPSLLADSPKHPSQPRGAARVSERWKDQELLAVLAVMRHADRTPKSKVKFKTKRPQFVQLFMKFSQISKEHLKDPHKELKMKTPQQLQKILDLTMLMLGEDPNELRFRERSIGSDGFESCGSEGPSDTSSAASPTPRPPLDDKEKSNLTVIKSVLMEGGRFDGIYRKVQMKPTAFNSDGKITEVQLALKWGGVLTSLGVDQAESLGRKFRWEMYPGETSETADHHNGLLRLHATQRHDFKVYSSDEGRVQMTGAAFTRGLLDLGSGSLTPICCALVEADATMLDDLPRNARGYLERTKTFLHERLMAEPDERGPDSRSQSDYSPYSGSPPVDFSKEANRIPSMRDSVMQLCELLNKLVEELEAKPLEDQEDDEPSSPKIYQVRACVQQARKAAKPAMVLQRWRKLREDLYNKKTNDYGISKIPDIYDAVRYDLIHHPQHAEGFRPLYQVAKQLNDIIVPNEYGFEDRTRLKIGHSVSWKLIGKLLADLRNSVNAYTQPPPPRKKSLVTAVQMLRQWVGLGAPIPEAPHEPSEVEDPASSEPESPSRTPAGESKTAKLDDHKHFATLDPQAGHCLTPHRRVRTRLYFTSESHIHTLVNLLRYCHDPQPGRFHRQVSSKYTDLAQRSHKEEADAGANIVCNDMERKLLDQPVFGYLTQIVFRLYEDKRMPIGSAERFRVEISFSPGVSGDPRAAPGGTCAKGLRVEDRTPLHELDRPLTLSRLQQLLGAFAQEPPLEKLSEDETGEEKGNESDKSDK